ncbi:MAG: FHA domain-containing protein [Planctomycetota bacterium]
MYGELVPLGGGDPIPLMKKRIRVGRRDGCDIVLNYGNVSGHHCLFEIEEGYWFVRDLRSRNGVKIDGKRIAVGVRRRLDPESELQIAKHKYVVKYDPKALGAYGTPPQDEQMDDFFRESLLDRAGLRKKSD